MGQTNSVTAWFNDLQNGEEAALQKLWDRYSERLIAIASEKLANSPKCLGDEFDVANRVFHSLYRVAASGRLRSVKNRDQLWWLLLAMTKRKTVDHQRKEGAAKRGAARTFSPSDNEPQERQSGGVGLDQLITDEPTAESVLVLQETLDAFLSALPDDLLRQIALLRLEGYTVAEIAERKSVSSRTIERKLELIRKKWSAKLNADVE